MQAGYYFTTRTLQFNVLFNNLYHHTAIVQPDFTCLLCLQHNCIFNFNLK